MLSSIGMTVNIFLVTHYPDTLETFHLLASMSVFPSFHIVPLIFPFQLSGLLSYSHWMLFSHIIYCSCFIKYFYASLGTEWTFIDFWCLRRALIWMSSLWFIYLQILTILALCSLSRFISCLPPSWCGR